MHLNPRRISTISRVLAILLLGLTVVGLGSLSYENNSQIFAQRSASGLDLQSYFARLDKLVADKNLKGVLELREELDKQNRPDDARLFLLKSEVCKNLNSVNFADYRHVLYARQCAKSLLADTSSMPVDLEMDLVRIMQEAEEYRLGIVDAEGWPSDRKERLDLLYRLYERVAREYQPAYDFADLNNIPATKVCVPNSAYKCGIDPDQIAEPYLRDQYVREVEKNRMKTRKYNEQRLLHRIAPTFPTFVDRFIVGLFGFRAYDEADLESEFTRFGIFGERRTNILESLKANKR